MEGRKQRKRKRTASSSWLRNCSITHLRRQQIQRESRSQDTSADQVGNPFPTTLDRLACFPGQAQKHERQRNKDQLLVLIQAVTFVLLTWERGRRIPSLLSKNTLRSLETSTFYFFKKNLLKRVSRPCAELPASAQGLWEPQPVQVWGAWRALLPAQLQEGLGAAAGVTHVRNQSCQHQVSRFGCGGSWVRFEQEV